METEIDLGYIPHYNASRSEDGITLEFVGIRICDARNKPRNLRVHYICDRTAGFGSPEADVSDLCNIKVTWKSELAVCPSARPPVERAFTLDEQSYPSWSTISRRVAVSFYP